MLYNNFFIFVVSVFANIIIWQIFVRQIAKNGWFWVMVPEMTALLIIGDRGLAETLVVCNDVVWAEIKFCCRWRGKKKNGEDAEPDLSSIRPVSSWMDKLFDLVFRRGVIETIEIEGKKITRLKKSLCYIGRPWKYRVKEWYFTEREALDLRVRPLHSLTLAVMNIVYERERLDKTGVENLLTADGIEVEAILTFYGKTRNAEKAIFNIDYIKTFIRGLIVPAWRRVLTKFQFFQYQRLATSQTAEEYLITAMQILTKDLREELGIPEGIESMSIQDAVENLDKVARILFNEAGMILTDVTIGEFEPIHNEVKEALQGILIAKTEAKKLVLEWEGKRDAKDLEGQGEKKYLGHLGDDKQFLLTIRAIESATKNLGQVTTLVAPSLDDIFGPIMQYVKPRLGKTSARGDLS